MSQPLSPRNFILISVILHISLIGLFLFQAKNRGSAPVYFETQVVFGKEDSFQESAKKNDPSENVIEPLETDRTKPLQVKNVLSTPQTKGFLKANRAQAKGNLNPTLSPVGSERGSGLENFSKKWQRKNRLNAYKAVLARIVSENWILPPINNKDFQILIETIIRSDGSIAQTDFLNKTGMVVLDEAALKSIRISVPFPKFQKFDLIERKSIRVVFRFTPEKIDN